MFTHVDGLFLHDLLAVGVSAIGAEASVVVAAARVATLLLVEGLTVPCCSVLLLDDIIGRAVEVSFAGFITLRHHIAFLVGL